jgi:hypothetical protein
VIARPEPVERVVYVLVPVEVIREVPGPERIVEVPVPVERTTNVCPVEVKPAKRKSLAKPSRGLCR